MLRVIQSSVDFISSLAVMLMLAIGSVFALFFIGLQIHAETAHLIRLSSSLLSQQPDWLSVARNFTEGRLAEHDIDEYVEQVC